MPHFCSTCWSHILPVINYCHSKFCDKGPNETSRLSTQLQLRDCQRNATSHLLSRQLQLCDCQHNLVSFNLQVPRNDDGNEWWWQWWRWITLSDDNEWIFPLNTLQGPAKPGCAGQIGLWTTMNERRWIGFFPLSMPCTSRSSRAVLDRQSYVMNDDEW